ncbi:MAG: DEAD/DEAH box helicase [Desulforhopalus sp.]
MISDVSEYLSSLKNSAKFGPQVVCHRDFTAIDAKFASALPPLDSALQATLCQSGITSLYSHQYYAICSILEGNDVLVATPTASGKSMIYNLPVLNDLFSDVPGHSLYLFPLKALAQDQHNVLEALYHKLPKAIQRKHHLFSALFDGDTSSYRRRKIREQLPCVLFTNPEMVHLSLLPYHKNWTEFFSRLRYVVIDEVHSYRGVLGSHMAWVLRRLQRIAAMYGANPTFILLSATIGNPEELGELLLNKPVEVISESGAPQAEKSMVLINPWDSAAYTASQLLEASIKRGLRTIVYTQSRKMTELINLWTAPRLGQLRKKLSAYRAGFLPEERREIERQLFSGELLGVISTSALELGIDIGDLDLCILVGYPGSIMATWQRGGRVGRGLRKSAIIMIAQEDALDQYFMRRPEDFFARSPESAVLNPENNAIMDQHLLCCAAESPLSVDEITLSFRAIEDRVKLLSSKGTLLETATGGRWISARKYPQHLISLRGGGKQMSIIDMENGEVVGEIDTVRGMKECHPGAVYIHRATTWLIDSFDLFTGEVIVHKETPKFFTRPLTEKRTEILDVFERKNSFGVQVSFGKVKVTERVTGYQKRHSVTHKLISTTTLDLPDQIMETEGLWLDIPAATVTALEQGKYHFMGAIHAMEHAMIALFPLLVLCDRNDIGGISCPLHDQTEMASIFIYDGYPGGVGLAKEAFRKMDSLLKNTEQTIATCGCNTGCPSCVHSPRCGSGNRPIDKKACLFLLAEIFREKSEIQYDNKSLHISKPSPMNFDNFLNGAARRKGLDALPAKFGVFDLETIRSAEEVGGWGKTHKMGVSVAVLYDSELKAFVTYLEHEVDRLVEHLVSLDLIIGFNNKRFDNRVLSAYTDENLAKLPTLDLLEEIHNHLGYRLSLNRLAEHTLGTTKTADGLQALKWYKEGRMDLIQKYCRKDVEITRDVLYHALEKGFLLFANKAKKTVRLPLALDIVIEKILKGNNPM